jgi:hypothetical protein
MRDNERPATRLAVQNVRITLAASPRCGLLNQNQTRIMPGTNDSRMEPRPHAEPGSRRAGSTNPKSPPNDPAYRQVVTAAGRYVAAK